MHGACALALNEFNVIYGFRKHLYTLEAFGCGGGCGDGDGDDGGNDTCILRLIYFFSFHTQAIRKNKTHTKLVVVVVVLQSAYTSIYFYEVLTLFISFSTIEFVDLDAAKCICLNTKCIII